MAILAGILVSHNDTNPDLFTVNMLLFYIAFTLKDKRYD